MDAEEPDLAGTVPWRDLLAETSERLLPSVGGDASVEAKWMVEEASGMEGAELLLALEQPATNRTVAHLDAMVERRLAGEPIQYVLGHWAFRSLDLLVDDRVLIPRPETEQVVGRALEQLDELRAAETNDAGPTVVDLGTGTGAIALSVAVERPGCQVWATEASAAALAVARANLAGLGMAASGVRMVEGSWFEPLPAELQGTVSLLVSNPPYVADDEELPESVARWEPTEALISGPTGLECFETIAAEAPNWLRPGGALVLEIGATQGDAVARLAAAGLEHVQVLADHAGLDRVLVARRAD